MTETPEYVGAVPWMAQWWLDHLDAAPVVVIRCGCRDDQGRQCRKAIGEVKADDDGRVLSMSHNDHPEVTTDWDIWAATTAEELAAELAERDAQTLHRTGEPGTGSITYKHTPGPREVDSVTRMTYFVCRVHGEVEVDPAELAEFARNTMDTGRTNRTFWSHRAVE